MRSDFSLTTKPYQVLLRPLIFSVRCCTRKERAHSARVMFRDMLQLGGRQNITQKSCGNHVEDETFDSFSSSSFRAEHYEMIPACRVEGKKHRLLSIARAGRDGRHHEKRVQKPRL